MTDTRKPDSTWATIPVLWVLLAVWYILVGVGVLVFRSFNPGTGSLFQSLVWAVFGGWFIGDAPARSARCCTCRAAASGSTSGSSSKSPSSCSSWPTGRRRRASSRPSRPASAPSARFWLANLVWLFGSRRIMRTIDRIDNYFTRKETTP